MQPHVPWSVWVNCPHWWMVMINVILYHHSVWIPMASDDHTSYAAIPHTVFTRSILNGQFTISTGISTNQLTLYFFARYVDLGIVDYRVCAPVNQHSCGTWFIYGWFTYISPWHMVDLIFLWQMVIFRSKNGWFSSSPNRPNRFRLKPPMAGWRGQVPGAGACQPCAWPHQWWLPSGIHTNNWLVVWNICSFPLTNMFMYSSCIYTGWWFGTFFIFPFSWDDDPIWLSYFSEG